MRRCARGRGNCGAAVVCETLEGRRLLAAQPSFSLSASATAPGVASAGGGPVAKVTLHNAGPGTSIFNVVQVDLATDSAGQNIIATIGSRLFSRSPAAGQSRTMRVPLKYPYEPDGNYFVLVTMYDQASGYMPVATAPSVPVTISTSRNVAAISAKVMTARSYTVGKDGPVTVIVHNDGATPVSTSIFIDLVFSTVPMADPHHSEDGIVDVTEALTLRPGRSRAFRLTAAVPVDLPLGSTSQPEYYWVVQIEQNAGTPQQSVKGYASSALKLNLGGAQPSLFLAPTVAWAPSDQSYLSAIATGDFNGDGRQDLVVLSKDGFVDVLLGNGDGTFRAPIKIALANPDGTSSDPTAVAVADFNGDGKPDLVIGTSNAGAGAWVLLGNGDGTFSIGPFTAAGNSVASIAVADFNGDGKPDVLLADDTLVGEPGTVRLLTGNGDGRFKAPVDVSTPLAPSSVVAADFNGDGKIDFACIGSLGGGAFLRFGNGDGTFGPATHFDTAGAGMALAVGDFNGDGKPDLAVGNDGNLTAAALINNGQGAFTTVGPYVVAASAQAVVVGDFNSDGYADMATFGGLGDEVNLLLSDGHGSFRDGGIVHPGGSALVYPTAGVVGDFNHDGKPDLALIILQDGVVTVLAH
jgi:hypothetical protein